DESLGLETRCRRQGTLVPFSVWAEIRDYESFGRAENSQPRICPDWRHRLVRRGGDQKGRRLHRRWRNLEGSDASGASAAEGSYPVYVQLGLGWTGGGAAVAVNGRNG